MPHRMLFLKCILLPFRYSLPYSFLSKYSLFSTSNRPRTEAEEDCRKRRKIAMTQFLLNECGFSESQVLAIERRKEDLFKTKSIQRAQQAIQFFRDSGFTQDQSEETLKLEIEYVGNLGILEGSKAFAIALGVVDASGLENFENKLKLLQTLCLLENEIVQIVRRDPGALASGIDKIKKNMDFLINTAGFQPNVVVVYPRLLSCSLDNRIQPRHKVIELLRETEPSRLPRSLAAVYVLSDQRFADKFLMGSPEAAKLFEKYRGKSVDLAVT